MKKGQVFVNDSHAGYILKENEEYVFYYVDEYLSIDKVTPVSLTLPLSNKEYRSETLFPFFDGLLPEGFLLDVAIRVLNITYEDRLDLLLSVCKDVIGNVSIKDVSDEC